MKRKFRFICCFFSNLLTGSQKYSTMHLDFRGIINRNKLTDVIKSFLKLIIILLDEKDHGKQLLDAMVACNNVLFQH